MSRVLAYYYDFAQPASATRERLILRPGYDGVRDLSSPPAYGSGVSDADWKALPAGFLKSQAAGDFGYDALPMGMFDPATRTFRFDLFVLYEAGDSDLEDVAHYLIDTPVTEGSFDLSGALTETIDLPNTFTVLSDLGDDTLDVEDFAVRFIGVQEQTEDQPLTITPAQASTEVTAIDLVRAAATLLTPQHLYDHVASTSYDVVQKRYVYSTAYESGGKWYLHAYGTPGDGVYQQHWAYSMSDLWTMLGLLMQAVMRAYLADDAFDFIFTATGGATTGAGPTSMLSLYDQSYADDGTDGGDEVTAAVMFIGRITMSDTGSTVGGWFHSGSPDGAHRFKTIWDMLKDAAEGHGSRARIGMFQDHIAVVFFPLEYDVPISMTVETPATEAATQRPKLRMEAIARAEGEIPDAKGADVGRVKVQPRGTAEARGRTIPHWFHCQPFVGPEGEVTDGGEVTYLLLYTGDDDFDGIWPGPMVGIQQTTWPVNTLVYVATGVVGVTDESLMRCHHRVKVYTGNISTPLSDDCTNAITPGLPTALNPDAITEVQEVRREQIRDGFWRKYRLSMLATQRTAGVPFAVCTRVVDLFSRWTQYGVEMKVPAIEATPNALGGRVDLDMASWLTTGDFLTGLDSKAFLVDAKEDVKTDTATVTLIAPGAA